MNRIPYLLPLLVLLVCSGSQRGTGQPTGLPLDPAIEAMIASVSADPLFSSLETLVGFHTRHTNSDTVSDLVGIGAARRWIHGEFERYASDQLAVALVPGYFTFTETACCWIRKRPPGYIAL